MDTDLLTTFLEVNRTRHFGRAADNLYITQAAVSARIRLLEQRLGVRLFTRDRNNIQLTRSGEKLVPYAEAIIGVWTRARTDIALEDDSKATLSVAAAASLWDVFLQKWLQRIHAQIPSVALATEVLERSELQRRIIDRTLDLVFVFDALGETGIEVRECFVLDIVLVSDSAELTVDAALADRYIHVDWGTRVSVLQAQHFPAMPAPQLRTALGRLARDLLLESGGAAYLARTMVEEDIRAGRLHRVAEAPVLTRTIYAAYRYENEKRDLIERVLAVGLPPEYKALKGRSPRRRTGQA